MRSVFDSGTGRLQRLVADAGSLSMICNVRAMLADVIRFTRRPGDRRSSGFGGDPCGAGATERVDFESNRYRDGGRFAPSEA
jgi:hypothetical protein